MSQEDIVKRPKYFAGQYLLEEDFELEQNYHIDRHRRYARLLTVSGIADGLEVTARDGEVYVAKGTAIAPDGTQIVWTTGETPIDLSSETVSSGTYTLSIGYSEVNSPNDLQEGSAEGYRRWLEQPVFSLKSPLPDGHIPLAKLTVDAQGKFNRPNDNDADSVRQYSGLQFPANGDRTVTLGAAVGGASDRVVLTGSLDVQGTLFTEGKPLAYENYEIYLRGSALNLVEAKRKPDVRIANVSLLGTVPDNASGLYTIILKPDRTVQSNGRNLFKVYTNADFDSQQQWKAWADWIKATADSGDVVAVVGCDAIPLPTEATAVDFLKSIGAFRAFQLRPRSAGTACRTPYALLFIRGRDNSAMEVLQDSQNNNDNAHLKTTYYNLLNQPYVGNLLVGGNVGVGTSAPKSTLSVAGGVAIGTSYAEQNIAPENGLLVQNSISLGQLGNWRIEANPILRQKQQINEQTWDYVAARQTGNFLILDDPGNLYICPIKTSLLNRQALNVLLKRPSTWTCSVLPTWTYFNAPVSGLTPQQIVITDARDSFSNLPAEAVDDVNGIDQFADYRYWLIKAELLPRQAMPPGIIILIFTRII